MTKYLLKKKDLHRYSRILRMQNRHKKEFFDKDGCGLEIEFGVEYEQRCRVYIETGLRKLKAHVGQHGKFTTDPSIGSFLDVEIVLKPYDREKLKPLFDGIVDIIGFYENFVFNENCGVHANFRADDALKESFYNVLVDGRYDSERFSHSKYKADFMKTVTAPDGTIRSYTDYIKHQNTVGAKYCGVNFLKEHLVEVRTLNLSWEDICFFWDAYDEAKRSQDINKD